MKIFIHLHVKTNKFSEIQSKMYKLYESHTRAKPKKNLKVRQNCVKIFSVLFVYNLIVS